LATANWISLDLTDFPEEKFGMKLPTWSEFLMIFIAAFITAISIHLLWGSYSQARLAQTKTLFAPIMLDKTTQLGP
jgi:hypothetical protein